MNLMLKKKAIKNFNYKTIYVMLKKSIKFQQFNPHTLPTWVESTRFFNRPYFPGWMESTLF